MKRAPTPLFRASGFSLVEVMVAVVVICVGLLGIAKMQAMAVSNTNMSRQRSLAAIEAASIASAMHSNREYWASFPAAFSVSIVSGAPAGALPVVASTRPVAARHKRSRTSDRRSLSPCIGTNNGLATCSPAAAGNSAALAAFDLARWWNALSGLLPDPVTATITCPATPVR